MDHFDDIWDELIASLEPGIEINQWNPYNGYIGERLTIITSDPDSISIEPPRVWGSQVISKCDFKNVWEVWEDYTALRVERQKIHGLTNHAKYVISILHWYEQEV
jgi:hypothetical protein